MHGARQCWIALGWLTFVPLLAGAAAVGRADDDAWYRREKVRCIAYLDASELIVKSIPQLRAMGFNSALVQWGGAPLRALAPLLRAADDAGLRLMLVTYFKTDDYLKHSDDPRRYVGSDGMLIPVAPCPTDERYWQATLGTQALAAARLRARHPAVTGLLFDIEDYPNLRDTSVGPMTYCFCDDCFAAFVKSVGKESASRPAAERLGWIVENNLWSRYREFQDDAVVAILAGIRRQIDATAPGFVFASYPWIYVAPQERDSRIDWDIRFARGLGTPATPFMLLDETTYIWGYGPQIERQQADYDALGLDFVAVTGFNLVPAERVWYPREMADSAYWACRRSDGYWFFLGAWPLLYMPGGREPTYTFGGTARQWVESVTALNKAITSQGTTRTTPLPLPPLGDHWTLSELYNVKHAPGARAWVRPWSEIGLPWEGGELVMTGSKEGDWFSFECRMGRPEREEIQAWLTTGPDRGIAQLYVDDEPVGEPVDLYSAVTVPGDMVRVGVMDLPRGMRTYKFVAVGRNERATGYGIGLRALWTDDVGYPPQAWSVIGPFDNTGDDMPGYDAAYPPEREIRLDAVYQGKRGERVRWRRVQAEANGYLDLLSAFAERDAVAYCLTYVNVPDDGMRTVLLGTGDGGKLWVNGELVWGEAIGRSPQRDEDKPRAHFRQGWNWMLVKVTRAHGAWGVYLRLYDPEGELGWSPTPPDE
ncbi:MAG: hypothetical protein JSV65_18190 [Armatimonadota bacterium]|nr:MAG: hypothetical protein JSV65_18190 [Armatimonadota bacterium]